MLRSHNQQELEFDFFISFLEHAINGEQQYKNLVEPIILDVVKAANKEKEITQLERTGLSVKILLLQKASALLTELDKKGDFNTATLNKLLKIINENRQTVFA